MIARFINKHLPIYIPASRRFTGELHLAIWNCGHCKYNSNLKKTLRDIRITVRKDYKPIYVVKKGAV